MTICMVFGQIKMIYKIIILISILSLELFCTDIIKCEEKIYARLDNYIVKRKEFIKDNECFLSDSLILNDEINQTINLIGKVYGLKRFYQSNIEILQVNTFAGVHTRTISFFKIEQDGKLTFIKNGNISSDVTEPVIIKNSFNDTLSIHSFYIKFKNRCRYLIENTFEYKNNTFNKIDEEKVLKKECQG